MNKIYINGLGINGGGFNSLNELRVILSNNTAPLPGRNVSLINRDMIQREDRAVLNPITLMAVNALHDLLSQNNYDNKSDWDIFTACDYTFDDNLLCDGIAHIKERDNEKFWNSLSFFSEVVNPLELLRGLPTNTLYHISKILNNNGKGLPVDAGNLSELTCLSLVNKSHPSLVISAGGQTGTKDKVVRYKNKLIDDFNHSMTWGGCALLTGDHNSNSIGSIQQIVLTSDQLTDLSTYFERFLPAVRDATYFLPFGDRSHDWDDKMIARNSLKKIDYDSVGYAGRPDMLTKLACFMFDDNVPNKSIAYLSGYDSQYGFGCAVIQKGV